MELLRRLFIGRPSEEVAPETEQKAFEERRQMQEVRSRLDQVREQLTTLDRRKSRTS